MRVLHATPLYWPSLGGGEQVTQVLSERLARDGHEVTVLTSDAASMERFWSGRGPRAPSSDETLNGVRIVRVPVQPFPLGQLGLFVTRGLAIRLLDPMRLRRLVRAIGRRTPRVPQFWAALRGLAGAFDVAHGFNLSWESCLVDAFEFARQLRYPYLATPFLHTGEPGRARVSRNYTMSHQVRALRGSDRVIVQTGTEGRAVQSMGVDPERIIEVGVGINPGAMAGGDADRFRRRYSLQGPIVVFIGRATRDKGATALVRAMQRVWAAGVEAECVIAGLALPDFKRFVQSQPPLPRLHCLGPIGEDDKRDLLAAADVVAIPSRAESFGIVYLEAWVYGKPVIGARAGGAADVIDDGDNGYLIPFDDADRLAERMRHLLSNPGGARRMGQAGLDKLHARYTWDSIYPKMLAVYQDVVRR